MTPFTVAGIQMSLSAHNNVDAMRQRLELLMHLYPWVQMVMYSELAPFGPLLPNAQKLPGPVEESFQEMARKHGVWLLPGSLFEKRDGKIFNTAPVIDPDGNVVARYRKMFPFRPFEEGVTSGDEFVVFDVDQVGRFGVSICYDIWIPETTRTLTAMGAEVILHPVLTHTIDRDVDLHIARASAAMFQCYVFDINGLAVGGNGRSAIFEPSGRTLHQASVTEELMPIEIDLDQVRRQRQHGLRTLGQPLKSFRDSAVDLTVYDPARRDFTYLDSLGPLVKQTRGASSSLDQPETGEESQATSTVSGVSSLPAGFSALDGSTPLAERDAVAEITAVAATTDVSAAGAAVDLSTVATAVDVSAVAAPVDVQSAGVDGVPSNDPSVHSQ